MKWYKDRCLYRCILICFLLALLSFAYFICKGQGMFSLRADFNVQQIPFTMRAHQAILNGEFGWLYNVDLGTNFVGAFSFYNLGSPFFWISLLFPARYFPYVVGWLYMLKYVVAGSFAYLYLRRFLTRNESAVFGAVLYAFSGFQSTNLLFYHFHDVVAFFPFLLLCFEKLLVDRKRGFFTVAVCVNCCLNYFFFIGEVIFLIIYFFCRFPLKKRVIIKNIILCCIEGLLGIGMAAFLFVPSIFFILDNPRATNNVYGSTMLQYSTVKVLSMIKALLLPNEVMSGQSAIILSDYSSTAAYLPGIGISFVVAYCYKKKDWITRMLFCSLIAGLIPLFTYAFYAFSTSYQRWWYMPILIMALASAKVFDDYEIYNIRKGILTVILCIIAFVLYLVVLPWSLTERSGIYSEKYFYAYVLVAVICLTVLYIAANKRKGIFFVVAEGVVCVMAIFTTAWTIHMYRLGAGTAQEWQMQYLQGQKYESLSNNYRYNTTDNIVSLCGYANPIGAFNSTVSGSIFEVGRSFGVERSINGVGNSYATIPGLIELLGGKYNIVDQVTDSDIVVDTIENENGEIQNYVVEKPACPIGFTYDRYILKSEFDSLDGQLKGIAAIRGMVIPDDMESMVRPFFKRIKASKITLEDIQKLNKYVKKTEKHMIDIYERNAYGFHAKVNNQKECYAFFSIPYEKGWSAYVNGEKTDIVKVNGLMAVKVPKGDTNIEFTYMIYGLKEGIIITIMSCLIFAFYMRRRKLKPEV